MTNLRKTNVPILSGGRTHTSTRLPATMHGSLARPTLLLAALVVAGCEFLDPTGVTNPTVTEEGFLETPNAAEAWVRGVQRQLAATVDEVIMGTEVASDNLFNNRTLFSKVFDIPLIEASDFDVTNIQQEVHRLREMAHQGLEVVVPADEAATDETRARLHFYRGYASLLAGELFVALPGEAGGPLLQPEEHLSRAVADFEQARALSGEVGLRQAALLAIARARYQAGDAAGAVEAASEIISSAPEMVYYVQFDNTDGPNNTMQFAIFESGQDEFQPLPRLDFLFPKYFSDVAGEQSPVAILKGEEAFLIVAEARIAQSDLAGARAVLVDLLDVVAGRARGTVDDRGQERGRAGGTWIYPNAANVLVAASPGATPRAGLVLTRSEAPVSVPTLSGTSVDATMIADANTETELLELLYLMRQEIFVVEGRRMTDLGIRFPVALEEALTNANVVEGDPALVAQIPSFIPLDYGLDSFDYTDGDTLVVIHHDMNRVLVENRSSDAVLPFH